MVPLQMADDVNPSSPNPCCAQWIKRSQKLEKSRDALRQSVKILEGQIERQSLESTALKKEIEKQQRQYEEQKAEITTIASINRKLEKHNQDMKVKITSVENTKSVKNVDEDEIGKLKTCILADQEEIKSLKDLLEKEGRKNELERKKTELEKKKAIDAWKFLKDEKRKGEECICLLMSEKKKADDLRFSLEKLKCEANDLREKLNVEITKGDDVKRQIEVEKLKAYQEKTEVESEKRSVEEQKRLIDEERKWALGVKNTANHLSQKLDEERRKREEVEKQLKDVYACSTFGNKEYGVFKNILKDGKWKLLKARLKLERKRVKHAERVAKQEKSEKIVLLQELNLLKQNLMQMLYRLNMFNDLVSHKMGSTDTVQKHFKKADYVQQIDFEPSQIQYGGLPTHAEPARECVGLPLSRGCSTPKTGINSGLESPVGGSLRNKSQSSAVCSTSIHFSDSKLMGSQGSDSVQNSASKFEANPNLSILGFPGAVVLNAVHRSCQVGVKDIDRNPGLKGVEKSHSGSSAYKVVAQVRDNSSKKMKFDNHIASAACLHSEHGKLHSIVGDEVSIVNNHHDKFSLENCSKRSAVFKNIEYKNMTQKSGQKNLRKPNFDNCQFKKSTVKCSNKKKAGEPLDKYTDLCHVQEAGPDISQFVIDHETTSFGNKQAFLKSIENLSSSGGCLKLLELDNYFDEVKYQNAMKAPLSPNLPEVEIPNLHLDGVDSHTLMVNDIPIPGLSDSNVIQPDVLHDKMRDTSITDNSQCVFSCDASKPEDVLGKSPFLLDTNTIHQDHCIENFPAEHKKVELEVHPISKNSFNTFSMRYSKSLHSPDVIIEPSSQSRPQLLHDGGCTESCTRLNFDSSRHSSLCGERVDKGHEIRQDMHLNCNQNQTYVKIIDDPFFDRRLNPVLFNDAEKLTEGNGIIIEENVMEHNIQHIQDSDSMPKFPHPTFSYQEISNEADPGYKFPYFVSFSSAKNVDHILKVISVFNAFTSEYLLVSKIDLLVIEVLSGLFFEDLQSEEKVAVFFSFFLASLSVMMSKHCKNVADIDSLQLLEICLNEISRVISSVKVNNFLDQKLHLDILFRLMENFLIEKEILVIGDVGLHQSNFPVVLNNRFHLDIANYCVLSRDVSVSQFIAGCTIFASLCIAVDDIGSLLTFSYKMLLTCQDDTTSVLRALHLFATICGKKFFNLGNYSFLVATISSVVTLLEGRLKSFSDFLPHNYNITPGLVSDFSPCKQCPFATNALCMDKLICSLLDVLEVYSLSKNDYPNTNNYLVTSNGSVLPGVTRDNASIGSKSKFDVLCDGSCAISRYMKVGGNRSYDASETVFCDFVDIISLVELVGYYMGWDWMYKEAMPRLLRMVQLCVHEEVSTALFVLVSNLGRRGISSGDYQNTNIAELRCKLSELVTLQIARKTSLSTQVAAIATLLTFLPTKLEDILFDPHLHLCLDSSLSPCVKNIQQWFLQLSVEQQATVYTIFDNEDGSIK